MGRFADSQSKHRYELTDDDWVEFRSELSFAEQRAVETAALRGHVDQESQDLDIDMDWKAFEIARLNAWTVAWSFTDDDGKEVRPTITNIGRLNTATAEELTAVLDSHVEKMGADEGKDKGSGTT